MYKGSCLCGKVKFDINSKIIDGVYCHCSECRKGSGTAFATNGNIPKDKLKFTQGEDNIKEFKENANKSRFFCKTCGSPMMAKKKDDPEMVRIRYGVIIGYVKEMPRTHIFVGSKANWDTICDNTPQYNEWHIKK